MEHSLPNPYSLPYVPYVPYVPYSYVPYVPYVLRHANTLQVEHEIRILKRLQHCGVVRLFEVIDTPKSVRYTTPPHAHTTTPPHHHATTPPHHHTTYTSTVRRSRLPSRSLTYLTYLLTYLPYLTQVKAALSIPVLVNGNVRTEEDEGG